MPAKVRDCLSGCSTDMLLAGGTEHTIAQPARWSDSTAQLAKSLAANPKISDKVGNALDSRTSVQSAGVLTAHAAFEQACAVAHCIYDAEHCSVSGSKNTAY